MAMSMILSDLLYHVQPPTRTRPPEKPMAVLALGLSRSGTDSLRYALMHLEYLDCYHGHYTVDQEVWADSRAWHNLLTRKFHSDSKLTTSSTTTTSTTTNNITAADLDAVLGNCMAVTEIPAVMVRTRTPACISGCKTHLETVDPTSSSGKTVSARRRMRQSSLGSCGRSRSSMPSCTGWSASSC